MGNKIKRVLTRVKEDYNDMQGPAPSGFHVPLITEWQGVKTIMDGLSLTTGNDWRINLHMPFAGWRLYDTANIDVQGSNGRCIYWSSSPYGSDYSTYASRLLMNSSSVYANDYVERASGHSVRCFKDSYEVPDSTWTIVKGTLGGAGVFWNQSQGLISITDGSTGYTIMDKNLGATTVYNNGDTLTQANMGNMYQRGNNYGFPSTGSVTTSSTQVNAQNYGPGNYYSGSTFITRSSFPRSWDSSNNDNLRGGVSQGSGTRFLEKQIYSSTPPVQPVNGTFSYTGSDQTWTVPYTQEYIITAKGAGSRSAAGGLAQGTLTLNAGDVLSIMVGATGSNGNGTKYGFGGSANGGSNAAGGGLSGVFTGSSAITASDSSRALIIGGGAGGSSAGTGGQGGGTTGGTGTGSYGTAGAGGTQTGRGSSGNAGASQFNGGNGSRTYGYGGGGGWRGGNGSIGDGSGDDDKGGGGGSGYVIGTASNVTLTQGGGAAAGNNGQVTIVSVLQ